MQRTCLLLLSMALVALAPAGCGVVRHCTEQTEVSLYLPTDADCPSAARAQKVFDAHQRQAEGFAGEYKIIEFQERTQIGPRKVCWYPGIGRKPESCTKGSRASRLAAATGEEPQVSDLARGPVTPCDDSPMISSGSLPIDDSDEECPATDVAVDLKTAAVAEVSLHGVDEYPARTVCLYKAELETVCWNLGPVVKMGGL